MAKYTDPWSDATAENIFDSFVNLHLDSKDMVARIPTSQRDLILDLSLKQAHQLSRELNLPSGDDLLDFSQKFVHESGETFRISLFSMMVGYLISQWNYHANIVGFDVDFVELKARMTESLHRHIEFFLPSRLNAILSFLPNGVIDEFCEASVVIKRACRDKQRHELLSSSVRWSLTIGAILWQVSDAIRQPVEHVKEAAAKVFLSYSSDDRKKVRRIESRLQNAGIKTWRDEKDIAAGSRLLDRITEGIASEADFAIVFLSPASVQSEWVRTEINLAYQREILQGNTFVIPVLLSDCNIPSELGIKRYVDAREGIRKPANEILHAITWHYQHKM